MPFHPERYPADWKAISRRIRERDGNACKVCRVANGVHVCRDLKGKTFMLEDGRVFSEDDGRHLGMARGSEYPGGRVIEVVLTVAHLGRPLQFPLFLHVARDAYAPEVFKLAALCQLHHLRHDARQHAESARRTRRGRLAAGDLFPR